MQTRNLVVTDTSRKTCQLINLIATCKGIDVSSDVEMLLSTGVDCSVQFPESYEHGTDCDNDAYDDFISETNLSHSHAIGDYLHYIITWALIHHCHENTFDVIYKYTKLNPQKDVILDKLYKLIIIRFSQLYRSPYFINRSNIVGSYHYKLKQKVNNYLKILNITTSIFDSADPYKYYVVRTCEKCSKFDVDNVVDYKYLLDF